MMTTTQLWLAIKRFVAQGILTKSDVGLPNVDNTSDANKPISTAVQSALNNKVDVVSGKGLSTNDYTTLEKDKLATIAEGAEVNLTTEETQDLVAAMFQGGTHTNITFTYDDVGGVINVTSTSSGSGLTQEEVEDIVGGVATQGTGINVTYDDINDALIISLTGESYTTLEKNKLASIEDNAKDDQTGPEIKALYEAELNTNAYTDTEKTKLSNIEENAKDDQTGGEIKALYEAEANTNAFTDTLKTRLEGVADGATANSTDAQLRDRSTHTGTQTASTISDFDSAADARITVQKGANGGLATLDGSGKVPSAQLPAFVDDVLEYADFASFPVTGETGKLYIDLTDNTKTYRWSGSAYVAITGSPGSTDAVPEGSTNLYFTLNRVRDWVLTGLSTATNSAIVATDTLLVSLGKLQAQINNKENTITAGTTSQYYRGDKTFQTLNKTAVGLSNVDNTSDASKPVSTAQQTALDAKADLSGGNTFSGSQKMSVTTLTYGATVTPDFSLNNLFTLTATGNFTLANPSNQTVGQGGSIRIAQDATGSRTIAYGSNWVFEGGSAPALTTTANAVDRLDYLIMATGEIHARLAQDIS